MARINLANASTGQNPLTNVAYNAAGLPTSVSLGSGDSSTYTWKQGVGPMATATFNVGTGNASNTLTWNANGTLNKLVITDTLNTADAQTCTYSYDDLSRLLTDNCGSTVWNQTFAYDPFGNVTKTGNPGTSWTPGYQADNRYLLSGGIAYDANGRLTNDTFDSPIGWDIEGNLINQSTTSIAYDGFNRSAGSVIGGVWTNYFFSPDGRLMGTVTNSGTIQKMFVPLPMTTAVYSSGTLQQYRRNDWQGSVRVASTPSKTLFSGTAYGAFGEPYAPKGTTNNQYAGLNSDISSGTEQVSLSRRYHPTQGRWISPDSLIPDVLNPQTFNAYHYAFNRPTSTIDPFGLHEINDCLGCVDDNFGNPNAVTYEINGMQVSAAAFNGAILGQGGSGLEFAFAPGSGIGPATSGTMGELGNWSFVPQYGEATTALFGDDTLSTANYVHGTWQFSAANNGFTVQLGVAVNWNFWGPMAGSLFSGVAIDSHGHVATYSGVGGGMAAGAAASGGVQLAGSNGNSVCALGGPFTNVSGTAGLELAGTGDYFQGAGDGPGGVVRGGGVTIGVGGGGAASVQVTGTSVHSFGHSCVSGQIQ